MTLLSKKQIRKADKAKVRYDNKTRVKLERAMRENGSLGRLTAVQTALRQAQTSELIHQGVKAHEALFGPVKSYEVLRSIVQTTLSKMGLSLDGVSIKFQFGPGCGECNHPHDKGGPPCAYPGCKCKEWRPANLLGIAAGPTMEAVRVAARAAGVETEIDRQV